MHLFSKSFLGALSLLVFTGCSHIIAKSEPVCRGVDWWEAGRTEGVAGVPFDEALDESKQRCQGQIDLEAFENGHDAGLVDFCTPSQGLALGRNGQPYLHTCPSFLEGAFMENYEAGRRLRSLESQVRTEETSKTL
jgi:hypothetical protein